MYYPFIIAGPCSAESKEQVLRSASFLKEQGVQLFRASLWKPRTDPDSFCGVGAQGISWLQEVQQTVGIEPCTEILLPEHIHLLAEAGIYNMWIGARTTSNPFIVQTLADTFSQLKHKERLTVMVKNGVTPDINLWMGAVKRLQKAGVENIIAVHRGFQTANNSRYRNQPLWSIALQMQQQMPHIPLLNDASHITGKSELVPQCCQQAIDIGFAGLMLEVHPEPEKALSDSRQQLDFNQFNDLKKHLYIHKHTDDIQLLQLRQQIDEVDEQILSLVKERMSVVRKIGKYKQDRQMPIVQQARYEQLIETRTERACEDGISRQCIETIVNALHDEAVRQQKLFCSS